MKSLGCRDLGIDCDFVTSADDVQELIRNTYEHSVQAHGEIHESMYADKAAALVAQMESAVRED